LGVAVRHHGRERGEVFSLGKGFQRWVKHHSNVLVCERCACASISSPYPFNRLELRLESICQHVRRWDREWSSLGYLSLQRRALTVQP
jgi:hypothetical protein